MRVDIALSEGLWYKSKGSNSAPREAPPREKKKQLLKPGKK